MEPLSEMSKALRELTHETTKQYKELKKDIEDLKALQNEILARLTSLMPREGGNEQKPAEQKVEKVTEGREMVMYCSECFELRSIKDAIRIRLPDGSPAIQGKCSVCGTTLFRMDTVSGVLVNDAAATRLGIKVEQTE